MFKKIMFVGVCILSMSTAYGMSQAVCTGVKWGAGIPILPGMLHIITQGRAPILDKTMPAILCVLASGAVGGIGGMLSYMCSSATLNTNGLPAKGDMMKIMYRARMSGLGSGMTATFALLSLWALQAIYPSRGIFNL